MWFQGAALLLGRPAAGDHADKEIIINDGSKKEICDVAGKYGFKSIAEEGMGLLKKGLITIDEYCKVLLLN